MVTHATFTPTIEHPLEIERNWTYSDYLQLPDDKRYEIIYGELFEMPAPLTIHQLIIGNVYFLLRLWVMKYKLGSVWLAPIDVILEDIATPVQPDVLFISNANQAIIQPKNIVGVPDLVVEVLSPTSVQRDRRLKFGVYENAGIPEYWIIHPKGSIVEVYQLGNQEYELAGEFGSDEPIQSPLLGALNFTAQELFPAS